MAENEQDKEGFEAVQARLAEIVQAVSDEGIPLDEALDLYEEAVSLGMRASDLLEDGIQVADEVAQDADDAPAQAD